MVDIIQLLRKEIPLEKDLDACLVQFCQDKDNPLDKFTCPPNEDFVFFLDSLSNVDYEDGLSKMIQELVRDKFPSLVFLDNLYNSTLKNSPGPSPSCKEIVHDFLLFQNLASLFPMKVQAEDLQLGSLLNFLYTHIHGEDAKEESFEKYLGHLDFAWSPSIGHETFDSLSLPTLVHYLTDRAGDYADTEDIDSHSTFDQSHESAPRHKRGGGGGSKKAHGPVDLSGIKFSKELLTIVKQSHHAPQVFDYFEEAEQPYQKVAAATIPFCWYYNANITNSGMPFGPYGERYCQEFQTTFNEYGLCYTYNNFDLDTNGIDLEGEVIEDIKPTEGCGKKKGLRYKKE